MTGCMTKTCAVFSSGRSLKYVLLWNGTLIVVAIGFCASCRDLSLSSVWAKDDVSAMVIAATATETASIRAAFAGLIAEAKRGLGRCGVMAHHPLRSATHFRADKPQHAGCRKRRLHPLSEDVAHQEERGEHSPEMHRGIQVVDQLRADQGLRQDQLDGRQRVAASRSITAKKARYFSAGSSGSAFTAVAQASASPE